MSLEEFERRVKDVSGKDFLLEIQAKYKEKQVAVCLLDSEVWFFSTATQYDAALESVLHQIEKYMDEQK